MQKLLLACCFSMILWSCSKQDNILLTPSFKKAIDDLNIIRSEKYIHFFLHSLDSAYAIVKNKRPLDQYYYYNFKAWYHHNQKDKNLAIRYTDSMLWVITPYQGVEVEYTDALVQKGILLQDMHLYSEALKSYYDANKFADKFMDECGKVTIYVNLSHLLIKQKKYREALLFLSQVHTSCLACDPDDFHHYLVPLQANYNEIGLCYEGLGQLDSAKLYYQKGLEFLDSKKSDFDHYSDFLRAANAVISGNLGYCEMQLGNFEIAEKLLNSSIDYNIRKGNDVNDAILTCIKLGWLYLEQNKTERLDSITLIINHHLIEFPSIEAEKRLYALESARYKRENNFSRALAAREMEIILSDSQDRLRSELQNMSVPTTFNYYNQKDELGIVKVKNQRTIIILSGATVLIVLLFFIAYFFRKNLFNARRHSEELESLNEELQNKNERLIETMSALENSQEENTRILKVIAHDLRSPINGIAGLTELMLLNEELNKEGKTELKMIQKITQDSMHFMDELLNMNTSFNTENKASTDLLELIDYCVNFLQIRASQKKQSIEIIGNHAFAPIYREGIWRVLNNLVSNAIKFSPEGATIQVYLFENTDHITISVKDQGIGIPENKRKEIFDVMGSFNRKGTAGEQSFGLGLAICLQIMKAHVGRIWLENNQDKGSCFYIELPKNSI